MVKRLILLALLLSFKVSVFAQAGSDKSERLFKITDAEAATQLLISGHNQPAHQIEINTDLLSEQSLIPGSLIKAPVNPHTELDFEIVRTAQYLPNTRSVIAKSKDGSGGLLVFSIQENRIIGKVYDLNENREFDIKYDTQSSSHIFKTADHSDVLQCGVDEHLHMPDISMLSKMSIEESSSRTNAPNIEAMASVIDDEITIDLLIVYTPAARQWAEDSPSFGSIESLIAQSMALSQGALDNSEIGINLRLVNARQIQYDELNDGLTSGERLEILTASPDFNPWEAPDMLNEVHDFRDQYGADLVAGFARIEDTGGLAWRLPVVSGFPEIGFSLNRVQQVGFGFTLIHEIGHNLGNVHDRDSRSVAPAPEVGGLFQYSTGFSWETSTNSFQTIMSQIPQNQATTVQFFSNPNVTTGGFQTGTNSDSGIGPANAALSMNQSKRSVAFYRPSELNSPGAVLSEDFIEVTMNREDSFPFPLRISNIAETGDEALVWNLDFDFVQSTGKINSNIGSAAPSGNNPELQEAINVQNSRNGTSSEFASINNDSEIFSTTFSLGQGFSLGEHEAVNGWSAFTDSEKFNISSANPSVGSTHFRFAKKPQGNPSDANNAIRVQSPFFGPQPFGAFEFTADINITPNTLGGLERYDLLLFDERIGATSSGVVFFTDGFIYVRDLDNEGNVTFRRTVTFLPNVYRELKIEYDPDNEMIRYFYGGTFITETPYIVGKQVDSIFLVNSNEQDGVTFDLDNIRVTRPFQPFSWLDVQDLGGVVAPGESRDIMLNFQTFGKEAGVYETNLVLGTNDPLNQTKVIPVRLNVNTAVSLDENPEIPQEVKLEQNFPNPFNPGTVINFELPQAANVTLEVYNVVGQKVATLINNESRTAGRHTITFDGRALSSGVYIYRLVTPQQSLTRRMTLIK